MARGATEIDRLIEQGLSRYGEGDLEGALLLWERALVIEPDNAQANSYVDYVRGNFELLTGEGSPEDSGPFGIGDDEPEYQIEILPGDGVAPAAAAPLYMDARDEGWAIGDDDSGELRTPETLELELEADEPPQDGDAAFEDTRTGESVSFDDNTREYPGGAGRPASALLAEGAAALGSAEFGEATPAFGSALDVQTPPDFGSQRTDVRRRDLGFVQPTEAARGPAPAPPELKMTLRTPAGPLRPVPAESDPHRAPTADGESGDAAPELSEPQLELSEPQLELELPSASDGLSASYAALGLQRSEPPGARAELRGPLATAPELLASPTTPPRPPLSQTRPMPGPTRPPALEPNSDHRPTRDLVPSPASALGASNAPTEDLPYTMQLDPRLSVHPDPQVRAATRDRSGTPSDKRTGSGPPRRADSAMISAPTRELGLRTRDRPSTEDETTGEVDVHMVRAARMSRRPAIPGIDPVDAQSAEILEDVDRSTPANETREDRTRRRISALLERADAWGREADLERAVAAVDLALSEDPNSALAQKLIHRNRDAIMNAFQSFLGDLQRAPALARPLHELGSAPISPRAAFLLSRVDGTLSLDEILDVSGMPRLEAYRYLCQLLLRGILR